MVKVNGVIERDEFINLKAWVKRKTHISVSNGIKMYRILITQGLHPCKTLWNVWEDILSKHHQACIPWIERIL